MTKYYKRVSDKVLREHLESKGAVLIGSGLSGVERLLLQNMLRKVLLRWIVLI